LPGFGGNYGDRFQQWNLSHTWAINTTTVNEFRFAYFREGQGTLDCTPKVRHEIKGQFTLNGGEQWRCPDSNIPAN